MVVENLAPESRKLYRIRKKYTGVGGTKTSSDEEKRKYIRNIFLCCKENMTFFWDFLESENENYRCF